MTFDVVDGWQHADIAVVSAQGKNRGLWQGEPYEADEWVTAVIVRRAGKWRCVRSALTPNYRSPVNSRGR